MDRYNKGAIYTNDNCIACNKCISNCSLMGANVSVAKNGIVRMEIDSRKCNDCGRCINVCVHNARSYRDDTDAFFADLAKGEKISVILAPAFFGLYGDKSAGIIGCLKSLGVDKVYDGGYGREISAYLVAKYLKESRHLPASQRSFISNTCPSLVTVIQKYHPFLLQKLIPIQPAPICGAIYAHKYLGDTNKIAYITTCIANKDEVESENTGGNLNYNVTISRLIDKLSSYNFDDYKDNGQMDLTATGFGSLVARGADFADIISFFFPRTDNIISLKGFKESNMKSMYLFFDEQYSAIHPLLSEITACDTGCISGPGFDSKHFDIKTAYSNINDINKRVYNSLKEKIESPEKFWKYVCTQFKYIRPEDFSRSYTDYSCQKFKVPKSSMNEIFAEMLKDTPQKQNINCRSCGYNTCSEMVQAIAFGYSRKESCIHYMNDLMEQRINTDYTTGLMTREAFIRNGYSLFSSSPNASFIIAVGDVNKLKIINDLYGFTVGNDALRRIAATLKQIVGENGLTARLGGGMFALIMSNNVDNLQRLQSCKVFDSSSLRITFPLTMHFGIRITDSSLKLTSALDQASLCMDYNISSVENTYTVYSEEYSNQTHLEADITSKMQPALDNGEFKLWFQPQYSSTDGKIVGAEALCRWVKSDGTIISPGLFIPIAEKNGFIRSLDQYIWESVFKSVRQWIDSGIDPVPVSINISRISLESDRLYYIIKRLKEHYQIPEKYIHFEITESAAINTHENLNSRIQKIRDLGFLIAMDDFGSGYSSLNSLRNMPIDILKLDMGFLRGEDKLNKGGTIITYVARMAQGLEYITVAEGVETLEQADFLRSIGVNIFQGFLFSKAVPEEQFLSLLKKSEGHGAVERPRTFGHVDVRKFMNPDSPESMMFEEYTGPAAIYEYDDETEQIHLIRVNKKYLSMIEMQDLVLNDVRKNLKQLVNKNSIDMYIKAIRGAVSTGKEEVCVIEAKTYLRQTPLWVKNHLWEISCNGHSHSLFFLVEDVTNEKITESTLEVSNNQLGLMLENSQVGMCLMHLEVNLKNILHSMKIRVLRVNQSFLDMSGFSEEEVLNWTEKDAVKIIHPHDRPAFLVASTKGMMAKFKEPFSIEYRALKKDGTYAHVKVLMAGIQQPDKTYMLITNYIII